MSDKDYKSEYQSLSFYSIGGLWGYAMIRLLDSNKEMKLRLAKCKKTQDFPATKKYTWEEVPVENMEHLSQVQKINFKPTDNFPVLAEKVIQELEEIRKLTEEKEEKEPEKEEE